MTAHLKRIFDGEAYDPAPAQSWWEESAPPPTFGTPALEGGTTADAVIIGAGYTGLSAALELATRHGMDVVVLDAARPGWGASGRNGGFCCFGGTKYGADDLIATFGADGARDVVRAQVEAIDTVDRRIDELSLDVDRHGKGEVLFVHREKFVAGIREEAKTLREALGVDAQYWENERCREAGLPGDLWHGGLYLPHGFGLHPMKYVRGLADAAHKAGVRIHGDSEVRDARETADGVVVSTPGGQVKARTVLYATNGYLAENLPEWFAGRYMPVLSNILVTRPLTSGERRAHGWTGDMICADTRALLHYFRVLPDGRMMFGGRGGTATDPASLAAMQKRLRHAFDRMFPAWANVETTHFWSGFVCLSSDRTAFIGRVPGTERSFASLAYWGGGVSMGSWMGERAGEMIASSLTRNNANKDFKFRSRVPDAFLRPTPRFPFAGFRRLGLRLAYAMFTLRDEHL
ncbi:MAG: FAD-binding oxidoreductase [Rhodobiaceae bacterium]|nr:FAD-binding oxidoreductase [Rhodobiaceae bacterium]MCC0048403.1 FAD-binding oxidoreductase [Rhodobiaceae bacterium]